MELTDKEKATLLDIAKNAIKAEMNHQEIPELTIDSETLKLKCGAS